MAAVFLLAGLLVLITAWDIGHIPAVNQKQFLPGVEKLPPRGSRLLVIAPHCDDETIGTGILIHRAVQAGLEVKVVLVTNGDGFRTAVDRDFKTIHPNSRDFRLFGYQRQSETIRALKKLGLGRDEVIFLGYPDGGIDRLWAIFWDKNKPYFDPNTKTRVSPYRNSFHRGVSYTGENLLGDLDKIVSDYQPTDIYYPHPNDLHRDHWGVNAFVKYLLTEKQLHIREHLYLVHRGYWPNPRAPRPKDKLNPPVQLEKTGTAWTQFAFLAGEAELKESALEQYVTQMRVTKRNMLSFVRSCELFGSIPDYKLTRTNGARPEGDPSTLAISDPEDDILSPDANEAADITGVYSYIAGDLWIVGVKTAEPVNSITAYGLHGRLFYEAGPVKRFDLSYYRGRVFLQHDAANSISSIPGIQVQELKRGWRLKVPLIALGGARAVFLNANSFIGSYGVDKTEWRVLRF